jgi:hypothetical protein
MDQDQLSQYKSYLANLQNQVKYSVHKTRELRTCLKESWFDRLNRIIVSFDEEIYFSDGAFDLFRIFINEFPIEILEKRLLCIASLARKQQKLTEYRKTLSELASKQSNQIFGAIFEINLLSGLIESLDGIELYPSSLIGNGNVEAKFCIEERSVYIEAKSFGYSNYDIRGRVGVHSIKSMMKQVVNGIDSKVLKGCQLHDLSLNNPSILAISLGFNADVISSSWAIEDYYSEHKTNVSYIIVFGSALCRKTFKGFPNSNSTCPLSQKELFFIENELTSAIIG